MKDCTKCKHAEWARKKNGHLHNDGFGQCTWKFVVKSLPPCMYWTIPGMVTGGYISRHTELTKHCAYYEESNEPKPRSKKATT